MPCDQVRINTVELAVANHDMLLKALEQRYGKVSHSGQVYNFVVRGYGVTLMNGQARSSLSSDQLQKVVAEIKQSYSNEVVLAAAKRFGYQVRQTKPRTAGAIAAYELVTR